jgi:hypothetical protein
MLRPQSRIGPCQISGKHKADFPRLTTSPQAAKVERLSALGLPDEVGVAGVAGVPAAR